MRLILSKPPRTSSEELRQELQWLTLTKRREMYRASLVYRCLHNQVPSYFKIRTNADMGNNCTRGRNKIYLPHVRTKYGRRSFLFQGGMQWNSLSEEMTNASDLKAFRKLFLLGCKI